MSRLRSCSSATTASRADRVGRRTGPSAINMVRTTLCQKDAGKRLRISPRGVLAKYLRNKSVHRKSIHADPRLERQQHSTGGQVTVGLRATAAGQGQCLPSRLTDLAGGEGQEDVQREHQCREPTSPCLTSVNRIRNRSTAFMASCLPPAQAQANAPSPHAPGPRCSSECGQVAQPSRSQR